MERDTHKQTYYRMPTVQMHMPNWAYLQTRLSEISIDWLDYVIILYWEFYLPSPFSGSAPELKASAKLTWQSLQVVAECLSVRHALNPAAQSMSSI